MIVLASDTTGKSLSVAVLRDSRLVGEIRLNLGYNHAVTHLPHVIRLLETCEINLESIDLFACTHGPGSFTGTRIGISSFKAMAYAAKKPAIGVSTLDVLSWPWRVWPEAIICPLLDARNGRVYSAAYRSNPLPAIGRSSATDGSSEWDVLIAPGNYPASDFLRNLKARIQAQLCADALASDSCDLPPILLTGDGADSLLAASAHSGVQPGEIAVQLIRLDPVHDAPSAAVVALLAEKAFASGAEHDPFSLNATYLTPSAAERKRSIGR